MAADGCNLALRILIVDPLPGVALALQRGKTGSRDLIAPSSASVKAVAFDFTVVVAPAKAGQSPRLLGPRSAESQLSAQKRLFAQGEFGA